MSDARVGCWGTIKAAVGSDRALWILFLDYLLSSWSDRMWAFAVPLLFVSLLAPEDDSDNSLLLLPASLYALLSQVACVAFGSAVGAWIDRESRKRVVTVLLAVQNGSVVLGAVLFLLLSSVEGVGQGDAWTTSTMFWVYFGLLTLCGAVGALTSLGSGVALKKDWVVVLTHNDPVRLATVNAIMRGIDLSCEIGAPMAFGIVLATLSVRSSLLFVCIWNAVSFFPEWMLLMAVYRMAEPTLSQRVQKSLLMDDALEMQEAQATQAMQDAHIAGAPVCTIEETYTFVGRWRIYFRQSVLHSSLSYCLLYLTVLQPSYLLTAYLKSVDVNDIALAGFRGVSAVVGLAATISVPVLLSHKVRVERLAFGMVSLQFLCLLPCLIAVFVTDASPYIFMASVAASRFALYGFDLCAVQIMQGGVPEDVRGVVNAAEGSLTNLASLLGYGLGVVVPDPDHFSYLVAISVGAVGMAVFFSASYWRRMEAKSATSVFDTRESRPE